MATETHSGIEIRNSVDNAPAEAGFRRLEGMAEKTARRVSAVGMALGTAAADIAGRGLAAAGHAEAGAALSSAAEGARALGTMLAPLGPQAALLGAAAGAAAGAVRSLADSSEEAKRRMAELSQSLRDAGASRAVEERRLDTPEKRAEYQHEARERMADLRVKLGRGATVSEADVMSAARWDPALARELMERVAKQNGGKTPEALAPLRDLYRYGADGYREPMERTGAEITKAVGARGWGLTASGLGKQYARQKAMADAIEALGPEIIEAARRGTGYSDEADALWSEMHAPKEEKAAASLAAGGSAPGALSPARADALSAAGIGYTGSPMRRTEELLQEIRDDARRTARRIEQAGAMA